MKRKMYLRILTNPFFLKKCGIESTGVCGHFKTIFIKIHRENPKIEVIKLEKVPIFRKFFQIESRYM